MDLDDKQLIKNYLYGDEESLSILIDRHLKPVFNFVYRLCGSKIEAEDITQDTFLKVWKKIKKYNGQNSFKTWLYIIARNTTIDYLRKKKDLKFSDFDTEEGNYIEDTLVDTEKLQEDLFAKQENKDIFEQIFNDISPIYKEIIMLHYDSNMTFEEISEVLKKSVNTVKSQHRRALILIREKSKNILNAPKN
jgi:RNA polymerase sigma-70 factor (ECF subfamily)